MVSGPETEKWGPTTASGARDTNTYNWEGSSLSHVMELGI